MEEEKLKVPVYADTHSQASGRSQARKKLHVAQTRLDVSKSPNRRTCKFTPQYAADFNRAIKEIILYIRGVSMEYEPPK